MTSLYVFNYLSVAGSFALLVMSTIDMFLYNHAGGFGY